MKEFVQIVDAYDRALADGRRAALATVLKVEGSSYRQAGARMLVTEDGNLTGAISGGCLEGDAMRKALLVIARNKPMVFTYDTSDDSSGLLAVGLGCNGIIHILFEPLEAGKPNAIDLIRNCLTDRKRHVILTIFSLTDSGAPLMTCLSMNEDLQAIGYLPGEVPPEEALHACRDALNQEKTGIRTLASNEEWSLLIAVVTSPIFLIIAGAGNDVIPLVKMADMLGWQTSVIDGRPSHATCQRFPEAGEVVVADAQHAFDSLTLDNRTAVLLLTHNYDYDLALLNQVIDSEVPYIGILGPRSKTVRMLEALPPEKRTTSNRDKVYGPTGFDLGAENAEEIALAILAEVKAVFAGRSGSPLRLRNVPIHEPTPVD